MSGVRKKASFYFFVIVVYLLLLNTNKVRNKALESLLFCVSHCGNPQYSHIWECRKKRDNQDKPTELLYLHCHLPKCVLGHLLLGIQIIDKT